MWRCTSRLTYGTKYCKNSPTIPEEALHAAVLAALNNTMKNRNEMLNILDNRLTSMLSEKSGNALNSIVLKNRIQELQKSMENLLTIISKADHSQIYDAQSVRIRCCLR